MATLLSLKRRINAAASVSKATRAMQMIAASNLKKAQDATLSTRPYVEKLNELTQNIVSTVETQDLVSLHPYIKNNGKSDKTLFVVLGPDKGLCGGLIANLLREYFRYQREHKNDFYIADGKKIESKAANYSDNVIATFHMGTTTPTFDAVYPMIKLIDEYYLGGQVAEVKVLYTRFNSFFSQVPTITRLLPIETQELVETRNSASQNLASSDSKGVSEEKPDTDTYVFEPSSAEILPSLLKHHLEMSFYQMMLESFLSEQASRMIAMQNATENANDIIEALRLEYNKTRQAKITSELLDITGAGIASAV